ncbi:hypothetical protein ESZ36_21935 [Colwellia demingiae]|uniref:Uncharacterized protein n=1 Tax=Colwellia demingiae TaxID=89401 RepID=A0A5C6Q4D0_9GAMM|nr:hypothetical protein [Colwellia demingiae]TWX63632.1 hypothetical protein ESZ36_21935 [Colwellia demingiae]
MPFINWLSTYLNELQIHATLCGYTWTIAGRTSHATSLMIIFRVYTPIKNTFDATQLTPKFSHAS